MKKANNADTGIYKYMDCSTAHITENDNNFLTANYSDLIIYPFPIMPNKHGFWLFVPGSEEEIKELKVSVSIKNVLVRAFKNDCQWVKLDADGLVHSDLKKYKW